MAAPASAKKLNTQTPNTNAPLATVTGDVSTMLRDGQGKPVTGNLDLFAYITPAWRYLLTSLLSSTATAVNGRNKLTANGTYNVSTSGSDTTGDGTSASPWRSLQHASDFLAATLDAAGFSILIQLADGTYPGLQLNGFPVGMGANYIIQGNTGDSSKVVINEGTLTTFVVFEILGNPSALVQLNNLTIKPLVNGSAGIQSDVDNLTLITNQCIFDGTAGPMYAMVAFDNNYNTITIAGTTIKGTWQCMAILYVPGTFDIVGGPVTLSGSVSWTGAAVQVQAPGAIILGNGSGWVGTATGRRFDIQQGGQAFGNGTGNLAYFPGNAAGTFSNGGGQYDGTWYYPAVQKNGLPATTDIAAGFWNVFKDTGGGGVYVAYNDAGTIKKVQLT